VSKTEAVDKAPVVESNVRDPRIPSLAYGLKRAVRAEVNYYWGLEQKGTVFYSQIHQESSWNPDAQSKYASGLAQFTPDTAKWISKLYPVDLGDNNPLDARWAIRACVRYDRWLYDKFMDAATERDRWAFTLSSYNGGKSNTDRDRKLCSSGNKSTSNFISWLWVDPIMNFVMFTKSNLNQIGRIKIYSIPIKMMDISFFVQFPSENLFGDYSMNINKSFGVRQMQGRIPVERDNRFVCVETQTNKNVFQFRIKFRDWSWRKISSMTMNKTKGLAFNPVICFAGIPGKISFVTTTALAVSFFDNHCRVITWINRVCQECDPNKWFGNVEHFSNRAAWAIKENRDYVAKILDRWSPMYEKAGFI
jgi:hypothetical protein